MTTAEEIAARYGATVAPGCVVQVIPRGVSGMPGCIWDDAKNTLVLDMPRAAAKAYGREKMRGSSGALKAAQRRLIEERKRAAAERREAAKAVILEMHERGMTPTDMIAANVGGQAFVYSLFKEMGLTPNKTKANYGPETPERVMEMTAQGMNAPAIGAALGITAHQVKHIRSKAARMAKAAAQ